MQFRAWPYRRFHPSYGLGWFALGLLIGIAAAKIIFVQLPPVLMILLIGIAMLFVARGRLVALILVLCVGFLLGLSRGTSTTANLDPLLSTSGSEVLLSGVIQEDPQHSEKGDTRIVVSNIVSGHQKLDGAVWVSLRGEKELRRGDRITFEGVSKQGFGPYTISVLNPTLISRDLSNDPLLKLRDLFAEAVRSHIVEPSASLGLGFVIGQRSSLPVEFDDQLRIVGLTHIVVASGYNLTILVRFAHRLLEKHSKYLTAMISFGLVLGFIAISGASPSMVRAGLVTGLTLLAWYYGRNFHPLLLIIYVMAITAFLNPIYMWADLGWWLSFLAFAGVLLLAPLLKKIITMIRASGSNNAFLQILIETFSAQVMTLPLVLLIFGQLPILAIVANMLAAPFVPVAMALTFIAGLAGIISPIISPAVALPAEIVLSYFVSMVSYLASPGWAQQTVTISPPFFILSLLTIGFLGTLIWRFTNYNFREGSIIE